MMQLYISRLPQANISHSAQPNISFTIILSYFLFSHYRSSAFALDWWAWSWARYSLGETPVSFLKERRKLE